MSAAATRGPACVVLVIAAVVSAAAFAQAPADFAGRWITVATPVPTGAAAQAATLRGDLGGGWGSTFVIAQDEAQLTVESVVFTPYDLQPQPRLVYALDGTALRQTLMLGRGLQEQTSRATWDGASLRLVTAHQAVDPATRRPFTIEVTQRLTLDSPTSLVVEATRSAAPGGLPVTTRTVYTKQQ